MKMKTSIWRSLLGLSLGLWISGNASAAYNTHLALIKVGKGHMIVTFQKSGYRLISEEHRGLELTLLDPSGTARPLKHSSMAFDPQTLMLTIRQGTGLWRSVIQNIHLDTGTVYIRYMQDSPTRPEVRGSWIIQTNRLVMGAGSYDGNGRLCQLDTRRTPACIDFPLTAEHILGSLLSP